MAGSDFRNTFELFRQEMVDGVVVKVEMVFCGVAMMGLQD